MPTDIAPPTAPPTAQPGHLPTSAQLVNVPRLITAFYALHPDATVAAQRVSFGTSGHRGSSLKTAFNEDHILAITQAICDYRNGERKKLGRLGSPSTGPLFLAQDTHAPLRTGVRRGARSACRQWNRDDGG